MVVVLLLWIILFFIFFILGFSLVRLFKYIGTDGEEYTMKFDEYFFLGFLVISSVSGILSILIPTGNTLFCIVAVLTLVLLLINYKRLFKELGRSAKVINDLSKPQLMILSFIVFFVLTAAVQKIIWLDTLAYHAQNIQWIRTYAVVPGLGNLHDRFAFNSMFFVISALFTFKFDNILIFPLNGICFTILIIKLFALYSQEINNNVWKAVFYMLILLISLLILIPNMNTPSPDLICAILTIYVFIMILDRTDEVKQLNFSQFLLFYLMIFTCVSYKISTLFLLPVIFLLMPGENLLRKSLMIVCTATLIIAPFLIRNFYLSGYLIYPFPAIDIFNVDWKIPIANVNETKSVIEGWARMPVVSYKEVLSMDFSEWIFPWFKQLNFYSKLLVTVNLFSVLTFLVMLFRKDFLLAAIQFIILINLVFWFLEAPDLRFAYGFIFLGFALSIAYIFRVIESSEFSLKPRLPRILLGCFLLIIIGRRIMFPVGTLKDPSLWIFPAPFAKVETKDYSTNFHYRIPVDNQECFYTEIPCVTYELNDVYLRGTDLQEGFKVVRPDR